MTYQWQKYNEMPKLNVNSQEVALMNQIKNQTPKENKV
jgi:hypothetical protein